MALKLEKCVIKQDSTIGISSDITVLEEGVALVRAMENGALVAAISSGDVDEVFIGFSMNRHITPGSTVALLTATIPTTAPYTIDLGRAVLNGEVAVYFGNTIADIAAGAPAAGEYGLSGSVLTFAAADAGKTVSIRYRYALTQVEANLLFGSDITGAFNRMAEVNSSLIEVGLVVTDKYAVNDDWNTAVYAYAGADGILTTDDTAGPKVGYVALLPSAADGFLGVEISV